MSDKRSMRADKKSSAADNIFDWLETIAFSVFLVIFIFTFIFRIANVKGQSMQDTLYQGDRLVISHLFYTPEQGDIVVIDSSALNETIIKRIIATSNQIVSVDYKTGTVKVDGKVIDEPYVKEKDFFEQNYFSGKYYNSESDTYEYTVPFGYVLVMGDNRNHSTDSRVIGCVSQDEIVGRALFRFYSGNGGKLGRID